MIWGCTISVRGPDDAPVLGPVIDREAIDNPIFRTLAVAVRDDRTGSDGRYFVSTKSHV
ncbi:hypothetical protein LC1Hm_0298 [Halomicrobium sp. LC1Hm]|nr:hypothetical protein LC1Hm_0298 [Halomicrobium sp. LC1Hm]